MLDERPELVWASCLVAELNPAWHALLLQRQSQSERSESALRCAPLRPDIQLV